MTVGFALDYIEKRMQAIGYGGNYLLKFRHLVLQPFEERKVRAYNEYHLLIEENNRLRITSDFGYYDLSATNNNEVQYEHFGQILIKNVGALITSAKFIQVIPLQKENGGANDPSKLELDLDN